MTNESKDRELAFAYLRTADVCAELGFFRHANLYRKIAECILRRLDVEQTLGVAA